MNLGSYILRQAYDAVGTRKHLDKIRAEHDEWARTAQLGTPYYSVAPTGVYENLTNRKIHSRHTFTERGRGIWTGQLLTDHGSPSWVLWREIGPLTTQRMVTAADCRAGDDGAFAAFTQKAHDRIAAAAYAEICRLYPESTKQLVAA